MKKTIRLLGVFLLAVLTFTFVSCSPQSKVQTYECDWCGEEDVESSMEHHTLMGKKIHICEECQELDIDVLDAIKAKYIVECDICGEDAWKSSMKHEELFGLDVYFCKDCQEDLDDIDDLFG